MFEGFVVENEEASDNVEVDDHLIDFIDELCEQEIKELESDEERLGLLSS